jgi:hypothetical protein
MKVPNWKTLTVEQYQAIHSIIASEDSEMDKQIKIIAALHDIPPHEVEAMPIDEFRQRCTQIAFLFTKDIPGKPVRYIRANGKLFKPQYKINKFRFAQYVEVLAFTGNFVDDLHKIMASVCDPVKGIFRRVQKNNSDKHEEVANDLLQARFIDVYHVAVFFYRVLRGSIKVMKDSLVLEMSERMPKERAEILMKLLTDDLDGFIPPIRLRSLRISA